MKTENISHPSIYISEQDVYTIRNSAADAEKTGMLHPLQLEVIYKNKWFRLMVPQVYGGQQVSLTNLLHIQEAVSWADGSAGWVVTLCNGAGWFGGFTSPEISPEIFKDEHVCLAGSGAPAGTAEITAHGYRINGTWKYASGIHHATYITANCIITKNGDPVLIDNAPLIRPFIFDRKDVEIIRAWEYMGMMATGSDTFEIKDVEVAANRQFKIDPAAAFIKDPIYLYPFLQLAETTIAVAISGIALHFMDLCREIFAERTKLSRISDQQKALLTEKLDNAETEFSSQRKNFYDAVELSCDAVRNNDNTLSEHLIPVSQASHALAKLSRELVDQLYPLCGLGAAHTGSEINRAWRDLHTASQHSLLVFASSVA